MDAPIANTFYTPENLSYAAGYQACRTGAISCEQGIDDQSIESALLRLTWQMSQNHKFSIYYDEINKFRGHGMNAGDDPRTASQVWTSPRYNSAAAKYTGTLSSSMLVEGGYSFNYEEYIITNQDGVNKTPFSPTRWSHGRQPSRRRALSHTGPRPGQLGRPVSDRLTIAGRDLVPSPARSTIETERTVELGVRTTTHKKPDAGMPADCTPRASHSSRSTPCLQHATALPG